MFFNDILLSSLYCGCLSIHCFPKWIENISTKISHMNFFCILFTQCLEIFILTDICLISAQMM